MTPDSPIFHAVLIALLVADVVVVLVWAWRNA